jgi:cell division protein ZapE
MLMDLFFETAPVADKRRAHFHAFMADVHARVHAYRQKVRRGEVRDPDPIGPVAADLADEASLLCFDEFSVTDIADAMILGRLFTALFAQGVTVVATSNVEPSRLYEGGLNRALFLPFLALLGQRMDIVMLDARTDFRLEKLGGADVWHVPADEAAGRALDDAFRRLTGGTKPVPVILSVQGRELLVPQAAQGVARFTFEELCQRPLGASDYLAIASRFHTVLLDAVPVMDFDQRNAAKRFITLIDAFYDGGVKLVASADAEPDDLYVAQDGREVFEFQRTASRLTEMRSHDYLSQPHGKRDSQASGDTTGLVET